MCRSLVGDRLETACLLPGLWAPAETRSSAQPELRLCPVRGTVAATSDAAAYVTGPPAGGRSPWSAFRGWDRPPTHYPSFAGPVTSGSPDITETQSGTQGGRHLMAATVHSRACKFPCGLGVVYREHDGSPSAPLVAVRTTDVALGNLSGEPLDGVSLGAPHGVDRRQRSRSRRFRSPDHSTGQNTYCPGFVTWATMVLVRGTLSPAFSKLVTVQFDSRNTELPVSEFQTTCLNPSAWSSSLRACAFCPAASAGNTAAAGAGGAAGADTAAGSTVWTTVTVGAGAVTV
ncbi:hypothetical protein J2S89_002652 [Arthrobacter bambusae]|nr:hypothetical protein [Arthrobacter bambusae]MDQ0099178.1 hypothetical protein [Arthrobacter bambusae]